MLFETEQKAIAGNHYTYQRLLNETLILQQRYLRRARRLEKLASDPEVDGETRRQAECNAAELERAVHDVSYLAPSYLAAQKLLPRPKDKSDTKLSMTAKNTNKEEKDPSEVERIKLAGEFRRQNIIQQQQQQQWERWLDDKGRGRRTTAGRKTRSACNYSGRVILLRITHISNNKYYSLLFFSLFSISFFAERIIPSDLLYAHGKKYHK